MRLVGGPDVDLLRLMMQEEFRVHVAHIPRQGLLLPACSTCTDRLLHGRDAAGDAGKHERDRGPALRQRRRLRLRAERRRLRVPRPVTGRRRAGRANFIVAMPFLLPFTFRRAYLGTLPRDIIFYLILIIVPGVLGVLAASIFIPYRLLDRPRLRWP